MQKASDWFKKYVDLLSPTFIERTKELANAYGYNHSWYIRDVLRRAAGNSLKDPSDIVLVNEAGWKRIEAILKSRLKVKKNVSRFENRYIKKVLDNDLASLQTHRIKILLDYLSEGVRERYLNIVRYHSTATATTRHEGVRGAVRVNTAADSLFPDALGYLEKSPHTARAIRRWEEKILQPFLEREERAIDAEIIDNARLPGLKDIRSSLKRLKSDEVYEMVLERKQATPGEKDTAIFDELADETGLTYYAIKANYYAALNRKKSQKKLGN